MRKESVITDTYQVDKYLIDSDDLTSATLPSCLPTTLKDNHFAMVLIPCFQYNYIELLLQSGYYFADRVVEAHVSTKRSTQRCVRARFVVESEPLSEPLASCIQDVACHSFQFDSRFRLRKNYDPAVAASLLRHRIIEAQKRGDTTLAARFEGELAGFALLQHEGRGLRIGLAAVEKRFQASGISADLYTAAFEKACEGGFGFMVGTISTANTAVVNLYGMLGARFSQARDVYILAGGERS